MAPDHIGGRPEDGQPHFLDVAVIGAVQAAASLGPDRGRDDVELGGGAHAAGHACDERSFGGPPPALHACGPTCRGRPRCRRAGAGDAEGGDQLRVGRR